MTREEVQNFLAMVQATYPNYNPPSKSAAINAWTMALEEFGKNDVALAFKAYMQTNASGFAPAPGQIIEKIQLIRRPQYLNEMEAWALVSKALRNSGYNSVSEFSKLPTLVQKAVGLPDQLRVWALDENYNEQVVSSNFIKTYRNVLARDEEISKIPKQVRALIEKANENSDSGIIEQKRQRSIDSLREREQTEKLLEMRIEGIEMPDRARRRKEELLGKE